jgi:glycine cleavage system H protein
MDIPQDLRYTEEHEWLRLESGQGRVGITAYAQEQLGDVVYVEVPQIGSTLSAMQPFGVVESVKAASDLFSPVGGTVAATNDQLKDHPELVNTDPYGDGWIMILDLADPSEAERLMDASAYASFVAREG